MSELPTPPRQQNVYLTGDMPMRNLRPENQAISPYANPDEYYKNNYNTNLTPAEQQGFQSWMKESSKLQGRDLRNDSYDYDVNGAYRALKGQPAQPGHGTDLFKKPNHPTFSNESMYHNTPDPRFGGNHEGGVWDATAKTYTPSDRMLRTTHDSEQMQRYFNKYEPDQKVILK